MQDILTQISNNLHQNLNTQPLLCPTPKNNNHKQLLKSPQNYPYTEDYFKLNRLGSSRRKKILNFLISQTLPQLWKKLIWKKIIHSTLTELEHFLSYHTDNYFNTNTVNTEANTQNINPKNFSKADVERCHSQFLITLENELEQLQQDIHHKTFLEYFYTNVTMYGRNEDVKFLHQ